MLRLRVFKQTRLFLDWLILHPGLVFLLLGTVFGLLICFRLQPLNGTDEFTHFPRAFQIESGQLLEYKLPYNQYGGNLPGNIVSMINDYRDLSRKASPQVYKERSSQLYEVYSKEKSLGTKSQTAVFTSDAPYPAWSYLPSVTGIFLARSIHAPLIWYVYLARIFSLLFWIAFVYLAIKVIPQGKWFIVTLALLPTSITESLTIGLSSLLLGVSWLLIALVLAVISKKIRLNWRLIIILTMLSLILSTAKQGYILLAALPLLIPAGHFYSKRYSMAWKIGLGIILIAVTVTFGLFTSHTTNGVVLTPVAGSNINSSEQVHYILHSPLPYLGHLIVQPFTKSYDTVYLGLVGIITNRLIYLSVLMIGLLYLALVLSWKHIKPLPQFQKSKYFFIAAFLVIVIGTYFLIASALFLSITQVGSSTVNDIAGRYFLPLLPLSLIVPLSVDSIGSKRLARSAVGLILSIIFLGLLSTSLSLG